MFTKVTGRIAATRDALRVSPRQFAIGSPDGCLTAVHRLRERFNRLRAEDSDTCIIKFDLRNAFNAVSRAAVSNALHGENLRQYWRLMYDGPSPLVVYGPNEVTTLQMAEGVRQGDSTSTLLFCLAVDTPLRNIIAAGVDAYMYCDDLTIISKHADVDAITSLVKNEFSACGLHVNEAKTGTWSGGREEPFVVLGVDLAETDAWAETVANRQDAYFDLLDTLHLHPHLKCILLRLCGGMKLKYQCSAANAALMTPIAKLSLIHI